MMMPLTRKREGAQIPSDKTKNIDQVPTPKKSQKIQTVSLVQGKKRMENLPVKQVGAKGGNKLMSRSKTPVMVCIVIT